MVEFADCAFRYKSDGWELAGLSATFSRHRLSTVVGRSGCGKTTLLYLAAGLLTPTGGAVRVDDAPTRRGRRNTALILQDFGLFPWKRVYENVALGLRLRGEDRHSERETVAKALHEVDLAGREHDFPRNLSGGERQRLAVARAIVTAPDLLLMDEPFSSLDAINRESLQNRLLDLHRNHDLTTIVVTHSIEEAAYLSDDVYVMTTTGGLVPVSLPCPVAKDRRSSDFFARTVAIRDALSEGGAR